MLCYDDVMDRKPSAYSLKAPGRTGAGMSLPGRGPFPRVDAHLVQAEITRDEIVGGRRVVASPANPPHAKKQTDLDFVIRPHVAPGYHAATDLLTRHDQDSDFATDLCIYKDGIDPETGARHLEEIAFEIVSEQNERLVTEKAVRMHRRGVRRIFTIWVKGTQKVCEWSPHDQSWRLLSPDARIDDPCLVVPLPVAALLDATAANEAVVDAMAASGQPAIRRRDIEAEARGKADAILQILDARGLSPDPLQQATILGCSDIPRLDQWLRKAAIATAADDILDETEPPKTR